MKFKKKSSPLKLLSQSQPNFAEMILGWSPFKIVSFSAVLYPRWLPLPKVEISSNGQNCFILSRKCPNLNCISIMMRFLTYITGFFMNFELLPILTDYANLKKGQMKLKKNSPLKLQSQFQPNFAEMVLGWSPFKIVSVSAVLYPRCSPLLKIEISSNGQNCSILSQKLSKFELYKHNDELFNIY